MIKVLIVEDDASVADTNKRLIESFNDMKVIQICSNGKEAYAFIMSNQVDLMFLDLYLPEMNGIELLSTLNKQGKYINTIMITAACTNFPIQKALNYGVCDFIIKPFSIERLYGALERFINQRNILLQHNSIKQNEVDYIFNPDINVKDNRLPKGLQKETLASIMDFLQGHKGDFINIDSVASHIQLSKVTIRKYMNHLLETRKLSSKLDYLTQGRPCVLYKLV